MTVAAILGPTAAGKTEVAIALAEIFGAEIVSVDSMQVYRGMDIGTAKPTAAVAPLIPHHLIDLVDPSESFSVAEFQAAGRAVLDQLDARGVPAIIAGGSGLHFRALVDPLEFPPTNEKLRAELEAIDPAILRGELLAADPGARDVVDLANPRRVLRAVEIHRLTGETPSDRAVAATAVDVREYRSLRPVVAVGIDPGDRLSERVTRRFDRMLGAGLLDEVAALASQLGVTASQAVGYKELLDVVTGSCSLAEGRERAIRATLALAKRQRTFFRRDPRIRWLAWHDDAEERVAAARAVLEEVAWTS